MNSEKKNLEEISNKLDKITEKNDKIISDIDNIPTKIIDEGINSSISGIKKHKNLILIIFYTMFFTTIISLMGHSLTLFNLSIVFFIIFIIVMAIVLVGIYFTNKYVNSIIDKYLEKIENNLKKDFNGEIIINS